MSSQVYETRKIAKSEQFSYWNDLVCNVFTQLNCRKKSRNGQHFDGYLENYDLNQIDISVVECEAAEVQHSKEHVSKSLDDVFLLHIQLSGQSLNEQSGIQSMLHNGDFSLCQSTLPYRLTFERTNKMMVVKIPRSILLKYIPQADLLVGLKVDYSQGISQLLINYLNDLWSHREHLDQKTHQITMSEVVLSLLSTTYEIAYPDIVVAPRSSVRNAHILRLRAYINQHLTDPELAPYMVAQANKISQRYLRMLFNDEGITCSQYILTERLKAVAKELIDPKMQGLKISEIAYRWGFNNLSHFSRSFKEKEGLTPKDFRQAKI